MFFWYSGFDFWRLWQGTVIRKYGLSGIGNTVTKWNRKYGLCGIENTFKQFKWNRKYGYVEQEIWYFDLSGLGNTIFCEGNKETTIQETLNKQSNSENFKDFLLV